MLSRLKIFIKWGQDGLVLLFIGIICLAAKFATPFFYEYIWITLGAIVLATFFYSYTFFKNEATGEKFICYLGMLALLITYFAIIYSSFGIIDSTTGKIVKGDWLEAIYFSVVTWTTLGYGDYKPITEIKYWVMDEALIGYLFMGLLVGKLMFLAQKKTE